MFNPYFGGINPTAAAAGAAAYTDEASYIIYKDGANYRAVNPVDGTIGITNADFKTVLDWCNNGIGRYIEIRPGTYTLMTPFIPQYINNTYANIFKGAGRGVTKIVAGASMGGLGLINNRSYMMQFRDMTLDGNNQANTYGLVIGTEPGDNNTASEGIYYGLEIKNVLEGIRFRDVWFYSYLKLVRVMDNIINYGIRFYETPGMQGDNGQTTFEDMVVDGGYCCLSRTPASGGIIHRVKFNRVGFYGTWNSPLYQIDLAGMTNLLFSSCDFESGAQITNGLVGLQCSDILFDNCQWFTQNTINDIFFLSTSPSFPTGSLILNCCSFYQHNAAGVYGFVSHAMTPMTFLHCIQTGGRWHYYPFLMTHFPDKMQTDRDTPGAGIWDDFIETDLDPHKWTLGGAGSSATILDQVTQGWLRLQTGTVSTNDAILNLNTKRHFLASKNPRFRIRLKGNTNSDIYIILGLRYDDNNKIYWKLDSSGTGAWEIRTTSGGADSGVLIPRYGASIDRWLDFWIDNGNRLVGCVDEGIDGTSTFRKEVTTNIPSNYLEPYIYVKTLATGLKYIDIDYLLYEQEREVYNP